MTLHKQTLIIISVIGLVLIVVVYAVASSFLPRGVALYLPLSLVIVLLVSALVMLVRVERSMLRRLTRLIREVSQVATEGDLSARVTVTGQDELARLGSAINGVIEALADSQRRVRQSEERHRQQAAQAEVLVRSAVRLNVHLDLEAVLDAVCEEAARALNVSVAAVYLYDEQRSALCPARAIGISPQQLARLLSISRALYDQVVRQAGPVATLPDVQSIPTASSADPHPLECVHRLTFASMRQEERLIGILCVLTADQARRFSEGELALLQGLAEQATLALANARRFDERRRAEEVLQQRTAQMEALRHVGLELASQLDLETLLRSIVTRAIHLMGATDGGLYLYRPEQDVLERVVSVGNTVPLGTVLRRGEGLSGRVWETGQPLIVDDYQRWAGRAPILEREPNAAVIGVPVRWGDRFLGALNVAAEVGHVFTSADAELMSLFAVQAAVALENAWLYNDLQRRVEQLKSTQAQLIHSARLVAVGELAAGVAHQLNNSLTPILGYAQLLGESLGPDSPYHGDLAKIIAKAQQASEIVKNLLDFARQVKPQKQLTNVNEVLRNTLALVRSHLEKSGVAIEETYAADLDLLQVDVSQMGQVFLNLINNAAQAMPEGGRLRLRTYRSGSELAVVISDSGSGIAPEVYGHLFEPFFTTKPERAGLGLAVSLGIVREHGGRIDVQSEPGQGSTFTVWLPLSARPEETKDGEFVI